MTEIDWATAEVDDGNLTVALSEHATSEWKTLVVALAHRLRRAGEPWDEVDVEQDRVIVQRIEPGAEDAVRHFLESVVLQANSATAPDVDDAESTDEPKDDVAAEPDQRTEQDDRAMTDAFRSFAAGERDE